MTICIAAKTDDNCIVAVSDRRLSYANSLYEATDDGVLKAAGLNKNWGCLFAFNDPTPLAALLPAIRHNLRDLQNAHAVRTAVNDEYLRIAQEAIVARYLARLDIHSIEEFLDDGHRIFGETIFRERLKEIEEFDLGVQLLVYGFDEIGSQAHIFEVSTPGIVVDHNLQGFGVVGSGFSSAFASLTARGSNAFWNVHDTVYRLCEAKFQAETADGVGKATTVMIFRPGGKMKQLTPVVINNLRGIWHSEREKPIPEAAATAIKERLFQGNFMKEEDSDT